MFFRGRSCCALRRLPSFAQGLSEIWVDSSTGAMEIKVRRQKKNQFGVGQLARIVSRPLWGGACPARLLSGWMSLRKWIADHRDHARRLAGVDGRMPLFVVLVRARLVRAVGLAEQGGTCPSKRWYQAVLDEWHVREATRELVVWEAPGVMENVYSKALSEEVAPEMRSAIRSACTLRDAQALVVDLDDNWCLDGEAAVGSDEEAAVRVWFHRFCALRGYLRPSIAPPMRDNFSGFLGRRVRRLGLSDTPHRVIVSRGADFGRMLSDTQNRVMLSDTQNWVMLSDAQNRVTWSVRLSKYTGVRTRNLWPRHGTVARLLSLMTIRGSAHCYRHRFGDRIYLFWYVVYLRGSTEWRLLMVSFLVARFWARFACCLPQLVRVINGVWRRTGRQRGVTPCRYKRA